MRKCNAQEEVACLAYAKGATKSDAYREGYPKSKKWSPESVSVKAAQLFSREHVVARVAELQEKSAQRNQITVDTLLKELEENRQAALCAETPQAAAATAATMGKAKLLGLDKQIIDLKSSDGSMTPKGAINIGELSDSAMAEILKARDAADS